MKSEIRNFLLAVATVTLVCAGAQYVWNSHSPHQFTMTNGLVLLGIIAAVSTLVHFFLLQSAKGNAQAFIRKFMAATVFKFLFYILLLVVLMLFTTDSKPGIIVHFLFFYVAFTIAEVGLLFTALNNRK